MSSQIAFNATNVRDLRRARARKRLRTAARKTPVSVEMLEARWLLSSVVWTGLGTDNNWNDAANWNSMQVPGASDDVSIGAFTVSVTDSEVANTISATGSTINIMSGGSLSFQNGGTISGTLTDAGTLDGGPSSMPVVLAGTTTVTSVIDGGYFTNDGQLNLEGGSPLNQCVVTNSGTMTLTDGVNLASGTLINSSAGTIQLADDTTTSGGTILNSGLFEKSAGTGSSIVTNGGLFEDLGGTVSSASGTLVLAGGSYFQNTTFTASSGAQVNLDNTQGTNTGNYYFSGNVTGSGAGNLNFVNGTANAGNPSGGGSTLSTFSINFAAGFANVESGMSFPYSNPRLVNAGYLQFVGDTQHPAIDIDNTGSIVVSGAGNLVVGGGENFLNDTTGTIDFETDASIASLSGGGPLMNDGKIEKTVGTGNSILGNFSIDSEGGSFEVDSGTLTMQGTDTLAGGTGIDVLPGAVLEFDNGIAGNGIEAAGNITGTGGGTVLFNSGSMYNENQGSGDSTPTATLNFAAGMAQVTGFEFDQYGGDARIVNSGELDFVGSAQFQPLALDNKGMIKVTGTGNLVAGSGDTFLNDTTGTIDLETDAGIASLAGNGVFTNEGKIEKTGGTGNSIFGSFSLDSEGGSFEVDSGTLTMQGADTLAGGTGIDVLAGAVLEFDNDAVAGNGIEAAGNITGTGGGTVLFNSGAMYNENQGSGDSTPTATLNFAAGMAQVTGFNFDLYGGDAQIINAGELDFVGSAQHPPQALDNQGMIKVTGTGDLGVGSGENFLNDTTGIIDFETDAGVTNIGGNTSFTNEGKIEKTGGMGTSLVGGDGIGFGNEGGTFDVESGTLNVFSGGSGFEFTIPDNGIVAAPGATFALGGTNNSGGISVQGNLTIGGGGTFELTGGYLEGPNSGYGQDTSQPSTLNFTAGQFTVNGGGFDDNTGLINEGEIAFDSGDLGALLNQGTVTLGNGVIVDSGGFINAASGVLLSGTSAGIFRQGNGGYVQNAGIFVMSPGAGNTFDMTGTEMSNTGTLIFGPGTTDLPWISNQYDEYPGLFPDYSSIPADSTFQLNAGAIVDVDTSPLLSGLAGTVIMNAGSSFPALNSVSSITGSWSVLSGDSVATTGNLTNNGTLSIGGTFTVNGDYTQASAQYVTNPPTPALDFEVATNPGDAAAPMFAVTGNTALAGNLTADYVNGLLTTGGAYTVATFANPATGSFASTAGTAPYFTPAISTSQIVLNGTAFSATGGSNPGGIAIPGSSTGGTGGTGGTEGTGGTGGATGTSPDLDITSVTARASFVAGSSQTITWSVTNSGGVATSGSWQDSVFLSSDTTLSSDDLLLGRVTENTAVAAGGSYTGTLTTNAPALLPGTYYVIVVIDSRQTLGETSYANNTAVSAATTESVPSLTLGQTANGTLTASQQQAYSLSLQSGQAVELSATFAGPLEAELYIGQNAVPSATSYIAAATNPNQTAATLLISAPVAGTYYILVDGRPDITGSETFSVTANLLPYGAASVSPTAAVAVFQTTLTVQGNGFTPATVVNLVHGTTSITASSVTFVNAQTLYATFMLTSAGAGVYDVQTLQPNGTSATLPMAFTINALVESSTASAAQLPGQIEFQFSAPGYIRVGGTAVATLTYENIGGSEVDAPLFEIEGTNAEFQLSDMTTFTDGTIDVIGVSSSGPAGVLEPGQSGSMQITYQQDNNDPAHTVSDLDAFLLNSSQIVDWDGEKAALKPDDQSQAAWDTTYANFEQLVGTTVSTYQQELTAVANQLGDQGYRTNDVAQYFTQILRIAGDFGAINQRDTLTSFGYGQSDPYDISLTLDSDGDAAVGANNACRYFLLQPDGSFVNEDAPTDAGVLVQNTNGTYTLTEATGAKTVFNADGSLNSFYDAEGNKTTAVVTNGFVTQLTDAFGGVVTLQRTSTGMVTQITDAQGRATTYGYDDDGNLTSIASPAGTTTFSYTDPSSHEVTLITLPDGTTQAYTYDSFGRINSESGAGGVGALTIAFDDVGNESITDALGRTSIFDLADDGSLASVQDPTGDYASVSTGASLVPALSTNAVGVSTGFTTDGAGDVTAVITPSGATISLAYDANHNLTAVTDPDGNVTTFTYDTNGNLLTNKDAAGATSALTYTAQGLLASSTSAAGRVVNNTYNSAGQLISQTFSDGTTASYTYDAHGNIIAATNAAGTDTFTYDAADRLTGVTYPSGLSLTYTYNSNGQLISTVDQTGFTQNYAYNAQGQLDLVSNASGAMEAAYTYDPSGRLSRTDLGNGTYTLDGYDGDARLNSVINYAASGAVLSSFAYTYDANGRITSMVSLAGTTTYTYDADGQLIAAALPDGTSETWTYDAAGNRISSTDSSGTKAYSTNDLNQYTSAGGTTYLYDADGNLISSTNSSGTTTFTYNVVQQLTSIVGPSGTTTFTYDALGNCIAETVNGVTSDLLVDPTRINGLVGQFSTAGAAEAQYIYGNGMVGESLASATPDYYSFDADGNVADLTGTTGAVLNAYTYLPFGQALTSTGTTANSFTFDGMAGVRSIGAGDYLTQARLYDSTTGRFTQRDSLGIGGGDINLYRYANNDPINNIDPSGHVLLNATQQALSDSLTSRVFQRSFSNSITNYLAANAADAEVVVTNVAESTASITETVASDAEGFVSQLEANAGGVFSEAGTFLSDESIPVTFGEVENFVQENAPAVTGFVALAGRTGTTFIQGAGELAEAVPASAALAVGGTVYAFTHQSEGQKLFDRTLDRINNLFVYGVQDQGITKQKLLATLARTLTGRQIIELYASTGGNIENESIETLEVYLTQANKDQRQQTESRSSTDPNDITGPAGYGAAGFIPASAVLPYQITFTNEASASAPAAVVTITEQISSNLDWSTFQFGNIGFGTTTVTVPAGVQNYATTLTLSSTLSLKIADNFDAATGVATWTFTTIDNSTGDVPSDPTLGFLPPDVTSPEGEGFVNYTVSPLSTLATGATLSAQASIVFDNNAAIPTSTITNTIDAVAPTSSITALPATATSTYFNLTWTGFDDANGSGIAGYSIYVSEDGGAYTPFLANTTATSAQFIGTPGHSYSFYSIATDNAGNQQPVPASAQASTTIPAIALTIPFGGKTKATYTDSSGKVVIITLSSGTGVLSFLSNGNSDPISMVLSGTTAKSTLTVKVAGGTATLGSVTINGSLKSFNAPDANFTQTFTITGTLGSLILGDETLTKSAIDIEGAGVATTIKLGTVHDLTLTDAAAIKSLSALSWTAGIFAADAITAPSIQTLSIKGNFDPTVDLTAAGIDLKSAKITGNITGGSLTTTGSIGTISANSVASTWTSTIAGSATTLQTKGDFDGAITAFSLSTAKIGGNLAGATLNFTASAQGYALKTLTVAKAATNSTVSSTASINSITVGGASNSKFLIGVPAVTTTLPTDASAFTANASLVKFTSKGSSVFSNTIIAAASIDTAKLANVTTNNGGVPFGISTKSLASLAAAPTGAKPIIYTKKQSTSVLATLPGDLRVELL